MIDHVEIGGIMSSQGGYGKGVTPNPFADREREWQRRIAQAENRLEITRKIESLFEPRFITPPPTSEVIEALITMTDSRSILELGTCTAFTTYHMLRAIVGKPGAHITTIDPRPAHDADFFAKFSTHLTHVNGWTPGILATLDGKIFDFVFIDSDHTIDHTAAELAALQPITQRGAILVFHDVPAWQAPGNPVPHPVRTWLEQQVVEGRLKGLCLPSCEQADCLETFGPNYAKELNPGLGIFIRQ